MMNKISVFICYSHLDVVAATTLRRILADCYGYDVFLADYSLVPSKNWYKDIVIHLECCEIFIPVISKNLQKSSFGNQEIGYSVKRDVIILPIRIDSTEPFAMIQYTGRLKNGGASNEIDILKAATEISALLLTHAEFSVFRSRSVESLVQALINSKSFTTTSGIVFTLERAGNLIKFSKKQVRTIRTAALTIPYINKSSTYFPRLQAYLLKYYSVVL